MEPASVLLHLRDCGEPYLLALQRECFAAPLSALWPLSLCGCLGASLWFGRFLVRVCDLCSQLEAVRGARAVGAASNTGSPGAQAGEPSAYGWHVTESPASEIRQCARLGIMQGCSSIFPMCEGKGEMFPASQPSTQECPASRSTLPYGIVQWLGLESDPKDHLIPTPAVAR